MKKPFFLFVVMLFLSLAVSAQTNPTTNTTNTTGTTTETKKKPPIFRASKDQIMQAQKMLKAAETGKMDDDFRAALKKYQAENGLRATGTLNRATLEKMNIALTDKQKEIPVSPNSFAAADENKTTETKKRAPVFRASKDQIMQAQKMLKEKGMYAGEQTGKLDDATREGLKKFQAANGVKATGTLNRETLEKMGIALTDKQKEM
ncbi:MAG TPA: peptidoglycan-binding domain-containing protein [Pyrinomonadaceae bacterium]|nr:peptidoglycan-binding domain-containing protein [Pyrinomonadaceae bacterium]